MAEGLLRALHGDKYEVYSAGVEASMVDPRAVKVMNEIGIDISGQHSKRMSEYRGILFDLDFEVKSIGRGTSSQTIYYLVNTATQSKFLNTKIM